MASPSSQQAKLRQLLDRAIASHQRGQLGEAERLYLDILKAEPHHFDAQHLLGIVRHQQGRSIEALALIGAALQARPDSAQALANQGLVLYELRRYEEALAACDKALALRGDFAEALNNRGNVLQRLKRYDEALASFDKVLALRGDFVEAHNNRGNALQGLKRYQEALASYDRALALRPGYAEAFYNRGSALKELARFDDALASFDRALALRPDHAETLFNRGDTLHELKRYTDAITSYERAIALRPDHPYAYSGLAESALAICDWARSAPLAERLAALVGEQKAIVNPFTLIKLNDDTALHRQCATAFIIDKIGGPRPPLWTGRVWSHAKVRIAYVSADFHSHATAYLMAELFERHDRTRFEVHGVSFGRDDGSDIRRRLIRAFDRFHDVRGKSDREVAKLLNDLEVDIAIDLKGYTQDSRPEILSHRPAPIQVSYLGYPGTMGADFIDYIMADKVVLPFDRQAHYAEKIVHLPDCYQVNDRQRVIAERTPTRGQAGLPDAGFVFCCFNNNYKITAAMFDMWMRLLQGAPESVLWLLRETADAETNLRREARARGVDPARLVFAGRLKLDEHLARHRLADLFLDTLPYNAHTTASDALWAGLPVLTCQGQAFASRVAGSLLDAVGLPELVTHTLDDYEGLALALAQDTARLAALRAKLAQNRDSHPLFDTDRFRRHVEVAYVRMWEMWQRGERPQSFAVEVVQS
jgi:protein O-GlcNAc transferase